MGFKETDGVESGGRDGERMREGEGGIGGRSARRRWREG